MKRRFIPRPNRLFGLCLCLFTSACGQSDMFTDIYYSPSFTKCSQCHAPNAVGFTPGTEATQDWTTRDTAYTTLQGNASGLVGNFEGCNGVPFLGNSAQNSLLVAVFDEDIRGSFSQPAHPNCDSDSISDMTLKINGPLSSQEMTLLKDWIAAGAPNQ